MKNIKFFLIFVALYSTACSTMKGRLPPDEKFISELKSKIKTNSNIPESNKLSTKERWAKEWFSAEFSRKKGNVEACPLYQTLGADLKFPLKDLAKQRGEIFCLKDATQAEEYWKNNSFASPWLKEDYLELSYAKARELKLSPRAYGFAKDLARFKNSIAEKVDLYKEVLELAQAGQDTASEKAALDILTKLSPSEFQNGKKIDTKDSLTIARDLEKKRQFNEARKAYYKIIKDKKTLFPEKMQAYERIRQSYRLERNDEMYVAKTEELIDYLKKRHKMVPGSTEYLEALVETILKRARLLWNKHETVQAEEYLLQSLDFENIPTDLLTEIYYVLGQMNVELSEPQAAVEYLSLAHDIAPKNSPFIDRINWTRGWLEFRTLNKAQDAIESFTTLENETKDRLLSLQAAYWKAKATLATGKTSEGEALLKKLAEEDPFGYYGILAHKELKLPLKRLDLDSLPKTPFFDTLEWLLAFGEKDSAQNFVDQQVRQTKTKEELEAYLPLFIKVGKFSEALENFYKWEVNKRNDALERLAPIFFPKPYNEIVEVNKKKNAISEEWIYSIMRQESGFNAGARSPSDAFGLMQLIPETAKMVSRENRIPYKVTTDLYNPETNIALGSALLKSLKNRFHNFPMATAAYNAGHNAVEGWKGRYDNDDVAFVENIPYAETQRYVKLVFRNLVNYQRLNAEDDIVLKDNPFDLIY